MNVKPNIHTQSFYSLNVSIIMASVRVAVHIDIPINKGSAI